MIWRRDKGINPDSNNSGSPTRVGENGDKLKFYDTPFLIDTSKFMEFMEIYREFRESESEEVPPNVKNIIEELGDNYELIILFLNRLMTEAIMDQPPFGAPATLLLPLRYGTLEISVTVKFFPGLMVDPERWGEDVGAKALRGRVVVAKGHMGESAGGDRSGEETGG